MYVYTATYSDAYRSSILISLSHPLFQKMMIRIGSCINFIVAVIVLVSAAAAILMYN